MIWKKRPTETDVAALNSNKVNTSAIANNLTTTASGKVLDARQGKALNDKLDTIKYELVPKSISTKGATDGFEDSEIYKLTCFLTESGGAGNPTSSGSWFILQLGSGDFGWQLALQTDSDKMYTRRKYTGTWNAWVEH